MLNLGGRSGRGARLFLIAFLVLSSLALSKGRLEVAFLALTKLYSKNWP
jgi:hypothetical protein